MSLPTPARSLSAKLLLLTIAFVMLAEVLIFLPSIARFRVSWLEERLGAGHLAALTIEAAPDQMVTADLERRLLDLAGARMIDLGLPGGRVYMLGEIPAPGPVEDVDLRDAGVAELIVDSMRVLATQPDRMIRVTGASPKDARATVTLVLDERPLAMALLDFAGRILLLSVAISLITATLVFLSLDRLLVRPMRRITASLVAFRRDPDDPAASPAPSGRRDEVGTAERELADMQAAVRLALRQQSRLAALGTAVTKVSHDLRNILATAAVVSERLSLSGDPEVRRVSPRLMQALDRAAELCEQTLAYTREGAVPLRPAPVDLAALAAEIGEQLLPPEGEGREGGDPRPAWRVEVPPGLAAVADRGQLHRALLNVARNALQAGARTVEVSARAEDGRLSIRVADDGPGLPPRARENLFRPFAGSARQGGTGLGLAIAREILREHGGDLRLVESTARGTVFALELPLPAALPSGALSHRRVGVAQGETQRETPRDTQGETGDAADGQVDRGRGGGPLGPLGPDHGLARR
jgi:signal transduction histidine kinase